MGDPCRKLFTTPSLEQPASPKVVAERDYSISPEHYYHQVAVGYEGEEKMRALKMEKARLRQKNWQSSIMRAEGRLTPDVSVDGFIPAHRSALCDRTRDSGIQHQFERPFSPSAYAAPIYLQPQSPISRRSTACAHSPRRMPEDTTQCYFANLSEQQSLVPQPADARYYRWRDFEKEEIDNSRHKLLLQKSVSARTEEFRSRIPDSLKINPNARGILSPEASPLKSLRSVKKYQEHHQMLDAYDSMYS